MKFHVSAGHNIKQRKKLVGSLTRYHNPILYVILKKIGEGTIIVLNRISKVYLKNTSFNKVSCVCWTQ